MKKQCVKCGELKDGSLFSIDRNQCNECRKQVMKQYEKQYYLNHIEEIKQYYQDHKKEKKEYRLNRKEEIKKYGKQYRLEHKEQIKQKRKQYYLNHKEQRKQYLLDNKEKIKQKNKQNKKKYYLEHKEKIKQHVKQYEMNHKEQRKQYRLDHKEEEKQRGKQYHLNHREQRKKYLKQYRVNNRYKIKQYCQSEAGKLAQNKHSAKKRKMKFILLINNPFPKEIMIDNHHILNNFYAIDAEGNWNKWFVIPMPKITHQFVGGSTDSLEHWKHNTKWIWKLYDINIKELLGQKS